VARGFFLALSGGLEWLVLALGGRIEIKAGVFNWLGVKGQRIKFSHRSFCDYWFWALWWGFVGAEFLFGGIVRSGYCCLGYGTSYDTWVRGCSLLHRIVGLVVTWYKRGFCLAAVSTGR